MSNSRAKGLTETCGTITLDMWPAAAFLPSSRILVLVSQKSPLIHSVNRRSFAADKHEERNLKFAFQINRHKNKIKLAETSCRSLLTLIPTVLRNNDNWYLI